jgi:hypothetical protein
LYLSSLSGPPLSSLGEQIQDHSGSFLSMGKTLGYVRKVSFQEGVQSACEKVNSIYGSCTSLVGMHDIPLVSVAIDQVNQHDGVKPFSYGSNPSSSPNLL